MSSKRSYELIELIRRKVSMASQIVSKDADYGFYAGADYNTARTMAMIDCFLRLGIMPKGLRPFIKLYRSMLNQQRKAFFASVGSTEITKLGFIMGMNVDTISAVEK